MLSVGVAERGRGRAGAWPSVALLGRNAAFKASVLETLLKAYLPVCSATPFRTHDKDLFTSRRSDEDYHFIFRTFNGVREGQTSPAPQRSVLRGAVRSVVIVERREPPASPDGCRSEEHLELSSGSIMVMEKEKSGTVGRECVFEAGLYLGGIHVI
ncbi:hypothetical protein EYF80_033306 [Liparis tanakae]|uniref:Uncharacterized protein n=1 Tax=Liparis tanakae TaxID=230148 RepID=A0A4Z2GSG0_9TELE|nr:hypothetical protein EYF80_033306 [Liparis tanakae]